MVLGSSWVWENLSNVQITVEHKVMLEGIFQSRSINLSDKEDMIVWCTTKSGQYSIKLGYQVLVIVCPT